jgi:hypothetical protein
VTQLLRLKQHSQNVGWGLNAVAVLRYQAGEDILGIALSADFPPCMLMRRMLEAMAPQLPKQVCVIHRHNMFLNAVVVHHHLQV